MPHLRPLLDRRLVVVSGKGGTGKTALVAALALAAMARGLRTVVVETGREEQVPARLGRPGPDRGYRGVDLGGGSRSLRMEPYAALAEYLRLQLRIPGLVTRLLDQPAFHAFLDAAPGWRELITLGKVWHLEQAREDDRPCWDILLVDAPATGHGLTFLDVPGVVISAVRAGPLRRHVGWVEELIRDPERTLLLPVTLAEELPVRETVELVRRAGAEVGIAIDRVVVNAVVTDPTPPSIHDLDRRLAALPAVTHGPSPDALAHAVRQLRQRAALQRASIATLRGELDLPLLLLPALPEGAESPEPLRRLGDALLQQERDR